MLKKRAIMWFRSDLRVSDNESLMEAIHAADEVIPIYVFDERRYARNEYGLLKDGPLRARFTLDTIAELRTALENMGSYLIVRVGKPEEIIFDFARRFKSSWVFCNRERTREETYVQDALEHNLWSIGQELRYARGKMLYYTQDLPFPITQTPDTFSHFRKDVERIVPVREPLSSESLSIVSPDLIQMELGELPDLADLYEEEYVEEENWMRNEEFLGGSSHGMAQLEKSLAAIQSVGEGTLKISPWLSLGALSPKDVFYRIENSFLPEANKKELRINLLVRDFHRLMGKKYVDLLFQRKGIAELQTQNTHSQNINSGLFQQWIKGDTKHRFVNACMRSFAHLGYLPHILRRMMAHYLIYELGVSWVYGAAYFESVLLDYDPTSNYGNWQRIAGVSKDNTGESHMNYDHLEKRFDPSGDFCARWCNQEVHDLWLPKGLV